MILFFRQWLKVQTPFPYRDPNNLVSVFTILLQMLVLTVMKLTQLGYQVHKQSMVSPLQM